MMVLMNTACGGAVLKVSKMCAPVKLRCDIAIVAPVAPDAKAVAGCRKPAHQPITRRYCSDSTHVPSSM